MNRFSLIAAAAVVSLSLLGSPSRADFIAYDNAAVPANQGFGNSLGLDFNVGAKPILVTELGTYDSGVMTNLIGVDGTSGVTVAIFDRTTGLQVGPSEKFTPTSPGSQFNGDAFKSLTTALELPANFQGSIVAFNDINYNSFGGPNSTSTEDNGGGLISFVGGGRYGGGFAYPTIVDGGPTNRYDAGTFQFTAVPAPSSLVLCGMGLLCLAAFGLRRRIMAA